MKNKAMMIAVVSFLVITIGIIVPTKSILAASTSDNSPIGSNSASNNNLPSSGSTESQTAMNNTLVLTAVPDKPTISAGDTQVIHIKSAMDNGTGISDATIQVLVQDYQTGKQKVMLGGQTDDKGLLDVSAQIGPHSKAGQFFVVVDAVKDNLKSKIGTGFAVTEKGSSSSSSSSSGSSRCSGSSCK